jgi:prepilin-type N-terminal cleavage/methylation domain-containing protein
MKKITTKSGFTLLETIVAIAIFSVSILAMLVTLSQNISNTNYAKRKIIASYLAQEGIEYARNMRDTYVLYDAAGSQVGWDKFKDKLKNNSCGQSTGCYINDQGLDYTSPDQPMTQISVTSCPSGCPVLSYNSATGKYGYAAGGVSSDYVRRIRILSEPSANEMKIASDIFWTQGSGTYSMTLSESMFNWVE